MRKYKKGYRKGKAKKTSYAMAKRINTTSDTHYFTRLSYKADITGNNTVKYGSWFFQLSDLPNVSEFTNLFDMYMIQKVEIRMKLQLDPGAATSATAFFPELYICNDYDDSTVPVTTDEIRQHQKTKQIVIRPNQWYSHFIKPAVSPLIYNPNNASSIGYGSKWNTWLDCADVTIPHYGVKYVLETLGTGNSIKVDLKYHIALKGVR